MANVVFEAAIKDAVNCGETLEHLAYVVLLWHTGVRKSEAYERPLADVTLDAEYVTIDFHERKKHGENVSPLSIPNKFYGVPEFLIPWIKQRQKARRTWKTIYRQVETGETRTTEKGNVVTVKKPKGKRQRDKWLFPHINSTSAWYIVKNILGPEYYPHYMRLRKLTRAAMGGENWFDAQDRIRKISGLKSMTAREAYIGTAADSRKVMRESE